MPCGVVHLPLVINALRRGFGVRLLAKCSGVGATPLVLRCTSPLSSSPESLLGRGYRGPFRLGFPCTKPVLPEVEPQVTTHDPLSTKHELPSKGVE
jgi:hypothetical protein